MRARFVFLIVSLFIGTLLLVQVFQGRLSTPLDSSLAPAFELIGKSTRAADAVLATVLPVDDLDEKKLGDAFAKRFAAQKNRSLKAERYLNRIMRSLSAFKRKPFRYRVFVLKTSAMNAFALPGGVILVTKGMLKNLKTESQLVSVLGHEMGHVELGHCFNAVKVQMTLKKAKLKTLGKILDFVFAALLRHSFSKTQEAEADRYGFKLLTRSSYHVAGTHEAFELMQEKYDINHPEHADLMRDYFTSHPPLELRANKYRIEAGKFIQDTPSYFRYNGGKNLRQRKAFFEKAYSKEWVRKMAKKQ